LCLEIFLGASSVMIATAAECNPSCFSDSPLIDVESTFTPSYIQLVCISSSCFCTPCTDFGNSVSILITTSVLQNSAHSNLRHSTSTSKSLPRPPIVKRCPLPSLITISWSLQVALGMARRYSRLLLVPFKLVLAKSPWLSVPSSRIRLNRRRRHRSRPKTLSRRARMHLWGLLLQSCLYPPWFLARIR
jgi:hypothetical protein